MKPLTKPTLLAALLAAALGGGAAAGPAEAAARVSRGPYLQLATPDGVTVRWRTETPAPGVVHFGTSPDRLDRWAAGEAAAVEHEVALTGLSPATRYYYAVSEGTESPPADGTTYFTTAPRPGSRDPIRAWVIGDSGMGDRNRNASAVRDAYRNFTGVRETDLWLMLGDNAYYTGTDEQYQDAVFETFPVLLRRSVLWPARGNHDRVFDGPDNDYFDFFTLPTAGEAGGEPSGTEAYFSFDHGNVHFITFDTEGEDLTPSGPLVAWLMRDLAGASGDWIVAFWHHPPYTKGTHNSDAARDSDGRMTAVRTHILPLLEAHGVDLVLGGHSHDFERSVLLDGHYGTSSTLRPSMLLDPGDGRPDGDGPYRKPGPGPVPHGGTVYVVIGSSSKTGGARLDHPAMAFSASVIGSVALDFRGLQLDAVFLDAGGRVQDRFTILKGGALYEPPAPAPSAAPALALGAPHPFRGGARLTYDLPGAGPVRLSLFDVQGRLLRVLDRGERAAGPHEAVWDGRTADGRRAAAGVYFSRLEFFSESATRRFVLLP